MTKFELDHVIRLEVQAVLRNPLKQAAKLASVFGEQSRRNVSTNRREENRNKTTERKP